MKLKKKTMRHFGVILENIDSKLDLVVEGVEIFKALEKRVAFLEFKLR